MMHQSTCLCRCPCHLKNNNTHITTHRNDDAPTFVQSIPPQPKRVAEISFTETDTYLINDSGSDPTGKYNPFRVTNPSPAGAAFSKSFLHVKNMVKNMTARWESLSEPSDYVGLPQRHSLTGRSMDGTGKRESVDQGEEKYYQWKYKSKVPENIQDHSYNLQPLKNNRNLRPINAPHSLYPNSEHQSREIQYETGSKNENISLQQKPSHFNDKVDTNSLHITEEFEGNSLEAELGDPANPEYFSSNFHSNNPFKRIVPEKSRERTQQNVSIAENTLPQNSFGPCKGKDPGKSPCSVQSEVKNIRKSFEEQVDEIVASVNRRSFDSNSHRPHSANTTTVVVKPLERHFNMPTITKSVANIENAKWSKESGEWETNTRIPSSVASKEDSKINAGSHNVSASALPSLRTQFETMNPSSKQFQNDNGQRVETSGFRGKSYENDLMISTGRQTATGSHHDDNKKRHSAPSKISLYSQHQKTVGNQGNGGIGHSKSKTDTGNEMSGSAVVTSSGFPNKSQANFSHTNHFSDQRQHGEGIKEKKLHRQDTKSEYRKSPLDKAKSKRKELNSTKSTEGFLAVEHHSSNVPSHHEEGKLKPLHEIKRSNIVADGKQKDEVHFHLDSETSSQRDSAYLALISVPNDGKSTCRQHGVLNGNHKQYPTVLGEMASVAVEMYGNGIRRGSFQESEYDDEAVLADLSRDYDEVVATPSNVRIEPIGHSVSVSNAPSRLHIRDHHHANNSQKKRHSAPATTMSMASVRNQQSSSNDERRSGNSSTMETHRGKREFYICHRCHKIVESGEAAFYSNGGFEIAWHPHCFKCYACEKNLSQTDHSFFDKEPYCLEDYSRVANLPKCFKCQELIFDSTYTSAAGNSWHQQHFTCHACSRPLVDAKYVFVENEYPYCLPCHEEHFPKKCKTCERRILPHEPYVQGGNSFWHSCNACLYCSSCNGSLVGRTLFFRKDGSLYCNRYCAFREM